MDQRTFAARLHKLESLFDRSMSALHASLQAQGVDAAGGADVGECDRGRHGRSRAIAVAARAPAPPRAYAHAATWNALPPCAEDLFRIWAAMRAQRMRRALQPGHPQVPHGNVAAWQQLQALLQQQQQQQQRDDAPGAAKAGDAMAPPPQLPQQRPPRPPRA